GPARTGRPRRARATPARGDRLARATVPRVRPWAEPGRAVSPRDVRWETASPRSVERSDRGAADWSARGGPKPETGARGGWPGRGGRSTRLRRASPARAKGRAGDTAGPGPTWSPR